MPAEAQEWVQAEVQEGAPAEVQEGALAEAQEWAPIEAQEWVPVEALVAVVGLAVEVSEGDQWMKNSAGQEDSRLANTVLKTESQHQKVVTPPMSLHRRGYLNIARQHMG